MLKIFLFSHCLLNIIQTFSLIIKKKSLPLFHPFLSFKPQFGTIALVVLSNGSIKCLVWNDLTFWWTLHDEFIAECNSMFCLPFQELMFSLCSGLFHTFSFFFFFSGILPPGSLASSLLYDLAQMSHPPCWLSPPSPSLSSSYLICSHDGLYEHLDVMVRVEFEV